MGDWTVYRLGEDGSAEGTVLDLTMDAAFGLMMNMAGFQWSIDGTETGGYRLSLARRHPSEGRPTDDPFTITALSAPIISGREDRRTAEREIKFEVLFRGCAGVVAQYNPPQQGNDAMLAFVSEWIENSGRAKFVPVEDLPGFDR